MNAYQIKQLEARIAQLKQDALAKWEKKNLCPKQGTRVQRVKEFKAGEFTLVDDEILKDLAGGSGGYRVSVTDYLKFDCDAAYEAAKKPWAAARAKFDASLAPILQDARDRVTFGGTDALDVLTKLKAQLAAL